MQFAPISYLRFARQRIGADPSIISFAFSGMAPPDPDLFGRTVMADLLAMEPGDHPALARDLAATWDCRLGQVLVQPGSHWTIFTLLAARLRQRPGPVAVEFPTYEPLLRIPQALGAEVVRVERNAAGGFRQETLDGLKSSFPSVFLFSHPHNPTGMALDDDDLERLGHWAEKAECAVLSDEVYLEFLEDWADRTVFGRIPGASAVRSLTKVMGLGSLRCTAALGPEEWIAEAATFTDYGPVALPGPSQFLARKAWGKRETLWARARDAAKAGRQEVKAWAKRLRGVVEVEVPGTGIICFVHPSAELHEALLRRAQADGSSSTVGFGLDAVPEGSHVWIEHLLRTEKVMVTPGEFFEDPHGFRLGYGGDAKVVREGLSRVERYFRSALEGA